MATGRKSSTRQPKLKKSEGRGLKTPSRPTLLWEQRLGYPRVSIIGIDEVGRGCLAGPVVAGAVILPSVVSYEHDPWLKDVADSKLLTREKRDELVPLIERWAVAWAVAHATVEEIDRINIFHASHLAMIRASEGAIKQWRAGPTDSLALREGVAPPSALEVAATEMHALVDGKFLPQRLPCAATAVVKGDLQCLSIAAASILAKVWRDRFMIELDRTFSGYGFASHKGYSTPEHAAALSKLGVTPWHRRSFAPVAERELERMPDLFG